MPYHVFAMDTAFYHSLGAYSFDVRCEMLRELGYDATYLTLWSEAAWQDLPRLATVKARYGLDVAGVYVTLNAGAPPDHALNHRIHELVETIEGCTQIEINLLSSAPGLRPSDPAGDAPALRCLAPLLDAAERRGLTLLLYPHVGCWLERIEDAVRLCREMDHPALRMVFCGYHWYALDGTNLPALLAEAAPYLRSANICGSRRLQGEGQARATIEPLDDGELDNFAVLGLLRTVGYAGPIGLQGYGMGGDVYTKLRRSLTTLRDMEQRLDHHPDWAQLRFR